MMRPTLAFALVAALASSASAAPPQFTKLTVTRRNFVVSLAAPFVLEPMQRLEMTSLVTGTVDRVFVDVGTVVKKGAQLVSIVTPSKSTTLIRAPFDGVIATHPATVGQVVTIATTPLVTVVSVDSLHAVATVNEADSPKLAVAQPVQLSFEAYPDRVFAAIINMMFPEIDSNTHGRCVEAAVQNPDRKLIPGMNGIMRVNVLEHPNVHVVPHAAVQSRGNVRYIVRVANNRAQERQVTIGGDDGASFEIVTGLEDNDTILVGTSLPADGTAIP